MSPGRRSSISCSRIHKAATVRGRNTGCRGLLIVGLSLVATVLSGRTKDAEQAAPASHAAPRRVSAGVKRTGTVAVTPVEGPSTLRHLGLTIERSSMGWGGQWSPPPSTAHPDLDRLSRVDGSTRPFLLTGSDLYRVSCRACHRPDGSGAPPEINSVIGP